MQKTNTVSFILGCCLLGTVLPLTAQELSHPALPSFLKWEKTLNKAVQSVPVTDSLYHALNAQTEKDSFHTAIYGYVLGMRAKHAWSPFSKILYAHEGCANLNQAVRTSPDRADIRYLRYAIEVHLPAVLGHSAHLAEDQRYLLAFLARQVSFQNYSLVRCICDLLIHTRKMPAKEESLCRNLLRQIGSS